MTKIRCPWVKGELDTKYHDTEWGRKTHDEKNEKILEKLLIILTIIFVQIIAMTI